MGMASMKPKNRIHSATRWPTDTLEMAALAKVDLEYVGVMNASRIDSPELQRIARIAQERLDWAVSKMGKGKPK